MIKTTEDRLTFPKTINPRDSSEKAKNKKKIQIEIQLSTIFLMIPVKTLYDEYIDWRKQTEQKSPVEFIVPPPLK